MNNRIEALINFREKYRKTISLVISGLVVGYFILKRLFYGFYEDYLVNDLVFECIIITIILLDFILRIITFYSKKKKS